MVQKPYNSPAQPKAFFSRKGNKRNNQNRQGVYRHFAIVAAEFFDLPYITKENINEWADLEGLENFQSAIAEGKGLLSIVAHFGNWELMTMLFLTISSQCILCTGRWIIRSLIMSFNTWDYARNTLIPKKGIGKKIMKLLKQNNIIGILSDQNVSKKEGVFVDFFGRPACTGEGLALIAMRSGAPVVPAFMARQKSGKYKLILKPAIEAVCTDDYERI